MLQRLVEPTAAKGRTGKVRMSPTFTAPSRGSEFTIDMPEDQKEGDFIPDWPWDFPPGSPGSRHTGTRGGSEAPKHWLERVQSVDPKLDLAWQPVSNRWVVWRETARGWSCVRACENPHTGEAMEPHQLFFAILYATDPARWPRAHDAYLEVRDMAAREQQRRINEFRTRAEEAERVGRRHAQISNVGSGNKFEKWNSPEGFGPLPEGFRL